MTVYAFYVVDQRSAELDFETRTFQADEPALDYGLKLLLTRAKSTTVEVWDGPLRLASYDRQNTAITPPR
jgi:hypothetical protein